MNGRFKWVLLNSFAVLGVAGTGILTGLPGMAQTTTTPQQPGATTGGDARQQVELNQDATQPGSTGQTTPSTQPSPNMQTSPTTTPGATTPDATTTPEATTPGTTTPGSTTSDTTTPETTTPGATTPTTTSPGTTTGSEQPADNTGTAAEQPINGGVRALW
jgi:hypothetical protein